MTLEEFIEQVRAAHQDWTDEQVNAEAQRLFTEQEIDPDPEPDPSDDDRRDRGMARLRREKQEAEARAKAAEDELAARQRKEAEDQGEWEKLAKQYETERDEARTDLVELRAQIQVERIARRRKFRNADEALALLPGDLDRSDEDAVDKALETLAENRPHLIDTGQSGSTGRPASSNNGGDLTVEQIKQMSPAEVNRRWDEVQPVIAREQT